MPTVRQRHGRTDGQTDGRTTYDSNTALALRASRGKNACRYVFPYWTWTWTWLFGRGLGLGLGLAHLRWSGGLGLGLEDGGLGLALGLGCCWTCYKSGILLCHTVLNSFVRCGMTVSAALAECDPYLLLCHS